MVKKLNERLATLEDRDIMYLNFAHDKGAVATVLVYHTEAARYALRDKRYEVFEVEAYDTAGIEREVNVILAKLDVAGRFIRYARLIDGPKGEVWFAVLSGFYGVSNNTKRRTS